MPFLIINGWAIPIQRGGDASPIYIGSMERAFDGTPLNDLRKLKRQWTFTTGLLTAQERDALIGLLHGTGDQWGYDISPAGFSPLYSDKGASEAGAAVTAYRSRLGSLQDPIYDHGVGIFPTDARFSTQSLTILPTGSIVNLFPSSVRTCEPDTSGFTSSGPGLTLSSDTTHYMQGLKSVKAITTSTGQWLQSIDSDSVSSSTWYVASFYYKGGDGVTIKIYGDGDSYASPIVSIPRLNATGAWTRCYVPFQTRGSDTTVRIRIEPDHGASATVWYFDAFQLELGINLLSTTADDYIPTTWTDGSRAAGVAPQWDNITHLGSRGLTLAVWAKIYPDYVSVETFAHIRSTDTSPQIDIGIDYTGTNTLRCRVDVDGTLVDLTKSGSISWGWHHLACTVGPAGPSSDLAFYVDGALVDSDTISARVDLKNDSTVYVGGIGTLYRSRSTFDSLVVLPYPAPASMIDGIATIDTHYKPDLSIATMPRMIANGEFLRSIPGTSEYGTEVVGKVTGITYEPAHDAGAYDSALTRVSFELESVGSV